MLRLFTKKQKLALALHQGFLCAICGKQLPEVFHADHIVPYSKGGRTDVCNGQALCPKCNLSKGDSIMLKGIKLRAWQEKASSVTADSFNSGKKSVLIQATPGGGKTIFGVHVYNELKKQRGYSHLIIVAPKNEVVAQWQDVACSVAGVELKNSMMYQGQADFHDYGGMVMTYAAMNERYEELRVFCDRFKVMVIADEIHHLSDVGKWGQSFRQAFDCSSNILMLTGTPWHSRGYSIPYVDYGADGYVVPDFSYSKADAIKDDVCRVTMFDTRDAESLRYVDKDTGEEKKYNSFKEADADGKNSYGEAVRLDGTLRAIFDEADSELNTIRSQNFHTAGGLIVAPDIPSARNFKTLLLSMTGEEYPIVHSAQNDASQRIDKFRKSNDKWLISVNMISEGVDIKRLQVCVYLSSYTTELFFRQVVGRIERRRNGEGLGDVDKTAYFYCLKKDELCQWIARMEDENSIGEKLRDEQHPPEKHDKSGKKMTWESDLEEIKLMHGELTASGFTYYPEVVAYAVSLRHRNHFWKKMGTAQLCRNAEAMLYDKNNGTNEHTHRVGKDEEFHARPLDVRKTSIRKDMNREFTKKIGKAGLSKVKDIYEKANAGINRACKIDSVKNASEQQLLYRLEYISRTNATDWI